MTSTGKLLLEIWKGDWNLPSVDPDCLKALTYARFSNAPIELLINNAPWSAPCGSYPVLSKFSNVMKVTGASGIIRSLENENYRCPHEMTPYEEADAYAIEGYLKSSVLQLLEYLWWVDEETFRRTTSVWYQQTLSFYGQLFWMHAQRRKFTNRLLTTIDAQFAVDNSDAVRKRIVEKAKCCLEDLSVKLAEKTFIFGLKPSALDASIFAYLAPLFYIPWKNKDIRKDLYMDNLDKFRNLKAYVDRVRKRYFEDVHFETQVVIRPQYWYHRLFEMARKNQDIVIFFSLAVLLNGYLLQKTMNRLRFRWPAFDDHAKQKVQESMEMIKNLGLGAEPIPAEP